jgi:DNA (cytosine-5)-methyltransferase 1
MPTAVSLFSGCGGFDLGAQQAGVEILWANDNDPAAVAAYRRALPDVPIEEGDIRSFVSFPKADLLIGCYPCTGFSQAAKRKTRTGKERDLKTNDDNFLYKEYTRVLKAVRPKVLFVENVKGMLSAAGGWFFEEQKSLFEDAGYRVQAKLIDASKFGVAQRRMRVFLVGVQKDLVEEAGTYKYPAPTHGVDEGQLPYVTLEDAISGMDEWPTGEFSEKPFHGHFLTRNRKRGWKERAYTVVAHSHHVTLHPSGEPMVKVGKDKWELRGETNRRLSWRECARLQGLPEVVGEGALLNEAQRVVGNAVPPPVAESLVKSALTYCTV